MISFEEIKTHDFSEIPIKENFEALYKAIALILKFSTDIIIPMLNNLLSTNDKENTIIGIYYRMHLNLSSLISLNKLNDFQSIAGITSLKM